MPFAEEAPTADRHGVHEKESQVTVHEVLGEFCVIDRIPGDVEPESLRLKAAAVREGDVGIELDAPLLIHPVSVSRAGTGVGA